MMNHNFIQKFLSLIILTFCCVSIELFAQGQEGGLDDKINDTFMPIAEWWEDLIFTSIPFGTMDIPIVLILLIGGAGYFTIYFKFINLRKFKMAIQVVRSQAFSTIISWSYYGLQSWTFLFENSKVADISYKMLFLTFTVLGAAVSLEAVIKFSDAMILALVFPNMIGLLLMRKDVKTELERFYQAVRRDRTGLTR